MSDAADLAERVLTGDLALHDLDEYADPETAVEARRLAVARETDTGLDGVGASALDPSDTEANIENMIGAVELPVGVAGPLPVAGGTGRASDDAGSDDHSDDNPGDDEGQYLPLATTEGALVASVNRGCSILRAAGSANARVTKRSMTRAPVFRVADVTEAAAVVSWVRENRAALVEAAEGTTSHGELTEVTPYVVGDSVFLRFGYDTKDAMGMNMATIATRAACEVVEVETTADLVALSGNLCADKKPAAINAVEGRGRSVVADATIPNQVIEDQLHATPDAIAEINTRKNLVGSAKAGSLGFNAHAANVVAGVFLATGQDAAQVVEGSNAITTIEAREDELYASVSLASLELGTVGGGTRLPAQSAALSLLGVAGGGDPPGSNADRLAEVLAAGALAGELSLLGALASRHLSSAHADLGR